MITLCSHCALSKGSAQLDAKFHTPTYTKRGHSFHHPIRNLGTGDASARSEQKIPVRDSRMVYLT